MGKLIFILGGARSGKSSYAQHLAEKQEGLVAVIATAHPGDDEMATRIRKHREARPAGWITREIPQGIATALSADPLQVNLILLDCLTLLVSNLLLQDGEDRIDENSAAFRVEDEMTALLATIRKSHATWVVVSNEVGLGVVPAYPLGRLYRDLLGRANQRVAAAAGEIFWLVAGIAVPVTQYREAPST